ncbi:tRNA 2-selenouridine(34) synthase MnmH [Lunatibacter salilacus]|uniref:tRNA 2-selenouridine(34) synthase MnmH n=1 Tax=Lunatibacter salilacus TaxID=2483804 RepID=UPI00131A8349|nr:tRNA 2-selenouridine(34) synthase MnmH [Lunatibacter salilacus]
MDVATIEDFLALRTSFPVLDTRSPGEFDSGHMANVINLPLFDNEERARVGTAYKQQSKQEAIKLGLEIVGPKMVGFIETAEKLDSKHLLIHCWRGGMRSKSVAWLMETYGFQVTTLAGGYKAYRKAVLDYFNQPLRLQVLTGATGSRKTAVLHALREMGEQVIDLEGLANHNGSSFGNQLSTGQPTTEQFQNDLFESFRILDPAERIWIEDESFTIGKVKLIEQLYWQKQQSPHILIHLPMEARVKALVEDYGKIPPEKLIIATNQIAERLGRSKAVEATEFIQEGNLPDAVYIILEYYDKAYTKGIRKKSPMIQHEVAFDTSDPYEMANQLLQIVNPANKI